MRTITVLAAVLMLPALAAVAGCAPAAKAFSREGLPVEYLDVYSASMGRRLWIYCAPGGQTPLDEGADPNQEFNANSLEQLAIATNKKFQDRYAQTGGCNATFNFPAAGNHSWPYWAGQLQALKPDLIATLNG